MLFHDDSFDPKDSILKNKNLFLKGTIIKKKNSEIESRLFEKTKYYVIAVGKRSIMSEKENVSVRAYIYYNGYICFYSSQGKAYNQQEYIKYIDFVKQAINKNRFQWTDFWINKGQIITRGRSGNIHVDNEMVVPISPKLRVLGTISEMSMQVLYDFLVFVNEGNDQELNKIDVSYDNGSLQEEWEKRIRKLSKKELTDKDGEIIVRTKIEGYNYVNAYIKSVIKIRSEENIKKIFDFLERLFYLEMYGYVFNMDE